MLVEYHRNLVSDKIRNDAFYRALKKVIRKNESVVADIGSGTGLLGFMASKLGAKNVYLYECGEVMDLAKKLAKDNKIQNVHFVAEHSKAVTKPAKVDVIVSETLGNFAVEEHIIDTIEDAKKRYLKPGGTIIPRAIHNIAAPVTTDKFYKELRVWDDVEYGFDYSAARHMSFNNIYVRSFTKNELLAPATWDVIDFSKKNSSNRKGSLEWTIAKDTTVYGIAVWWTCELVDGIDLSTGPESPRTHWEQLYFPIENPVALKKGDLLRADLSSRTSYEEGTVVAWEIHGQTASGKDIPRQSYDLRRGYIG